MIKNYSFVKPRIFLFDETVVTIKTNPSNLISVIYISDKFSHHQAISHGTQPFRQRDQWIWSIAGAPRYTCQSKDWSGGCSCPWKRYPHLCNLLTLLYNCSFKLKIKATDLIHILLIKEVNGVYVAPHEQLTWLNIQRDHNRGWTFLSTAGRRTLWPPLHSPNPPECENDSHEYI